MGAISINVNGNCWYKTHLCPPPSYSSYTHHPKLKLQNMYKFSGKNNFYVLLKCLHFDLQAIFLLFLRNVEKVMITLQAPNYADKWPILICHDNEVAMYHMIAMLILNLLGKRSLYLFCVDLSWSDLTVEAEIAPWRFQPKPQPSLTFHILLCFFSRIHWSTQNDHSLL